jgi:hypothetical protein
LCLIQADYHKECIDEDNNGYCDKFNCYMPYVDENHDGHCDICGKEE